MPGAVRVAVLVSPADTANTKSTLEEVQAAAAGMGLQIEVLNADNSGAINAAFEKIESLRPDALFVAASPFLTGRYAQLIQLAAFHRLPASYALREIAEAGGLMSYRTDIADAYRQIGIYAGLCRGSVCSWIELFSNLAVQTPGQLFFRSRPCK